MIETPPSDESRPLILRNDKMLGGVGALFAAMKARPALQAEFIENPSATLYTHVTGETLPAQRASVSNQLLFSILGNEKVMAWLRGYSAGRRDDPPDRETFMRDFSQAIVTHGGDSAVLSLIRATLIREVPLGLGEDAAFLISSSAVVASGVVASTDQKQSQGAAQDQRSSQNFAQSTRQDTPVTTTQNFDFDSDIYASLQVRATVEALVAHAAVLHENGRLKELGGQVRR